MPDDLYHRDVRSNLRLSMVHLLKIHSWPNNDSVNHWRSEVVGFQAEVADGFAPSMRQNIDLEALYRVALKQVRRDTYGGIEPRALPGSCPFALEPLLTAEPEALEALLAVSEPG
jgi:hypothetical protein